MKREKSIGLVLTLVGLVILLQNRRLLRLGWVGLWPFFLLTPGLLYLKEYAADKRKELLIPGTFFTGAGIFLFLFSLEYLPWSALTYLWPTFLLLMGLAFFLVYLVEVSDGGYLIPAGFFSLAGLTFFTVKLSLLAVAAGVIFLVLLGSVVLPAVNKFHQASRSDGPGENF